MNPIMSPEEFADRMRQIAEGTWNDTEGRHEMADELMCELLEAMGYEEGIEIFDDMEKWYS